MTREIDFTSPKCVPTLALVREVRKYEVLYNKMHRDHVYKAKKEPLWDKIHRVLFPYFDNLDTEDQMNIKKVVRKRWKSLRDCIVKGLRARQHDVNKPMSDQMKLMSFLIPYIDPNWPIPDKGDLQSSFNTSDRLNYEDSYSGHNQSDYQNQSGYSNISGYQNHSDYLDRSDYQNNSGYPERIDHRNTSGYPVRSDYPDNSGYANKSGYQNISAHSDKKDFESSFNVNEKNITEGNYSENCNASKAQRNERTISVEEIEDDDIISITSDGDESLLTLEELLSMETDKDPNIIKIEDDADEIIKQETEDESPLESLPVYCELEVNKAEIIEDEVVEVQLHGDEDCPVIEQVEQEEEEEEEEEETHQCTTSTGKRKRCCDKDDIDLTVLELLQQNASESKDEDRMFLLSIMSDFKRVAPEKKLRVKAKIVHAIAEALD